jgi:phospho-N-acetylmuramoyl-pentapeptide-transferase
MIPILIAATVAGLLALLATPVLVRAFAERGLGQPIREEGPASHLAKAGTPTMGGAAIVLAALAAYLVAHLGAARITATGVLVMGVLIGMAVVGFVDDLIKVRMGRNLGLNKTAKILGQVSIAVLVAWLGPRFAGVERSITVVGEIAVPVGSTVFLVWVFLLLVGASNAVNLTDGLDGLAAGSAALALGAYTLIAFWQFRNPMAYPLSAGAALDVAIVAAAATAAAAGFLWHNAPPARIIMGDTGSLALGGLLAAISIVTGTQVLLVLVGGLFVIETVSVIVQVAVFRLTGRRVFRMAPLHHHFELLGWQETTIIVRFWIIAGITVSLALMAFYTEYLTRIGVSP